MCGPATAKLTSQSCRRQCLIDGCRRPHGLARNSDLLRRIQVSGRTPLNAYPAGQAGHPDEMLDISSGAKEGVFYAKMTILTEKDVSEGKKVPITRKMCPRHG